MRRSFFTFCLGALIAFVASGVRAQDTDFIIESRSDGLNNQFYQEISGKWMDSNIPPELAKSSAPGASKCGTRKSAFSGPNITVIGPSAARFSLPTLQRASHLYVYATWPRGANAMPVNFRIRHAAGLNVRQIAQDGWGVLPAGCNAGQWILLGDYDFSGANQYVEVATENDATALEPRWYGQVYADAVRFTSKPLSDIGRQLPPQEPPLIEGQPATSMEAAPPVSFEPLTWVPSVTDAQKNARNESRNLLLFFHNKQSSLSQHFDQRVFTNPAIKAILQGKYVLVRLDIEQNREIANKLGAFKAGTINIYNTSGRAIAQINQPLTAQEFLQRLNTLASLQ